MIKKRITLIFLLIVTAFALYLSYLLFEPFLAPLFSAVVIAVVFYPVQARMHQLIKSPSVSALLSTILVSLIIIGPGLMLVAALTHEITSLYDLLDQKSSDAGGFSPFITQLIDKPMQFVGRYIDVSNFNPRAWLAGRLQQISGFVFAQAGMILSNLTSFIVSTVVAFFTLFFLFREGRTMRRRAAAVLPLSHEQVDKLFTGINNIIIATVYGGGVVAAVQGAMVGLALWVLGVPSPVLWSLVAAFFALIPLVGTAAVWLPAALYLGFTGSWVKAIILVAWGAGVVGLVDNFLRPILISGRVQMHTLLVFFSLFGGATVFGFLGLFIGPVIIALTITLLGMLRDELRTWQEFWHEQPAEVAAPVTPVVDVPGTPPLE